MLSLELFWISIIGFCVFMYVLLDGFTLGIGILNFILNKQDAKIALSAVLPTWDGNQTWLVLGAASLYGAFPKAFAILMAKLYFPLIFMVICLLLRGVCLEFFLKAKSSNKWQKILGASSLIISINQGLILGNFIEGFDHPFFNLFSILCGISLPIGYVLLGATRLILKTAGSLRDNMYILSKKLILCVLIAMFVVSITTPIVDSYVFEFWFNWHNIIFLIWLPIITGLLFINLYFALKNKCDFRSFWLSVGLFICPYIGFIISLYPYLVPFELSFYECAAPESTLEFITIGAVILLPTLLSYTFYSYYIFRGKITENLSY